MDFRSAQVLKDECVADGPGKAFEVFCSNRRAEFTEECNARGSTCQ